MNTLRMLEQSVHIVQENSLATSQLKSTLRVFIKRFKET